MKKTVTNIGFENAIIRMGALGSAMAEFDTGSDLARLEAIELLKKYPAQLEPMQENYLAHYIARILKKDAVYGKAVLTKGGKDSQKEDRRTVPEHKAWEAAKSSFRLIRKNAGLTDEKKAAIKNATHAAKTKAATGETVTDAKPKAESKIAVYKSDRDLAAFNVMALAQVSATNDTNAKIVRDSELMQKIARIIRDAKSEIEAEIKKA